MCKDSNGSILSVDDEIMYIDENGCEFEGTIIKLLNDNKLRFEYEGGVMTINASSCFILPS